MTILLKIWLTLFFSVLATVAYAENSRTWTPLGGDTGPAHSAGRKLASSPADDFALVDISSTISTDFKFDGAAAASNGKIIFAPVHADGVGVFDPTDNSFALVDISSTISTDFKFAGAATASNGKIIFTPYHADGVGVFDPTDSSFALVDISSTISTDQKFVGAATASNGKIIFAPLNADGVGVFQAVRPCDASIAPTNGGVGNCTSSLASGSSCQPTCDEGYSVTGTSSCIAGTLTAALCLTTCSRSSSLADVCCVDGTPHALESGVGHSAFCRITGISGAADCPPDWKYQPDHGGDGGQCIRGLSTRYGEGSGELTVIDFKVTAFNTCPTGNRETTGDMPLPCGSAEAVSSLCCVDPAFTLPSGASMDFFCKASKDGITAEECPNGWLHQGEHNQCMSFAPRVSSLSRCGASPPMSPTANTTLPPPLDDDDHAAGFTGILVALVATIFNML